MTYQLLFVIYANIFILFFELFRLEFDLVIFGHFIYWEQQIINYFSMLTTILLVYYFINKKEVMP